MASGKQIRDEIMKMTIVINTDPAQQEIHSLSNETKQYIEENKKLSETLRQLEKDRKADTAAVSSYTTKVDKLQEKLDKQEKIHKAELVALEKKRESYKKDTADYDKYNKKIDEAKAKAAEVSKANAIALSDLTSKQAKAKESLDKTTKEYNKLNIEVKKNEEVISSNKKRIDDLRGSMDVTKLTVAQLKKELALLNSLKLNVVPGSEAADKLVGQIAEIKARLKEVEGGADESKSSFQDLADQFNQYSGIIAAGAAFFAGFALSVKAIIDRNNELADAMTGVEKTTGLTKDEVIELSKAFVEFDTRTKKLDLLKMAEVGGRLGVAKEEILDFTQEVDKAYVALGDSWEGSAEDLANSLGKISKLYSETKNIPIATAINEVGSAMNELAASGASSEQNISDFVLRMGRTPEALRPPLNVLLGYGSAFEELGINSEIGSSGFSKFLRVAANDTKGFSEIMNIPVQQVKDMIKQNPAEFFLKFSEGLKGLDPDQLAAVLDKLKLSDQEVSGVIGAASSNVELFRKSVEIANTAVEQGTSLQDEFNKVNNNAAAIWEKVQRKMIETFTSAKMAQFLEATITNFGKFIGVVNDTEGGITNFREALILMIKIISIAAVSTFSYNAAMMLTNVTLTSARNQLLGYTVIQKLNNGLNQVGTMLQTSWNLVVGLGGIAIGRLTGATTLQTAAQQRLNLAMAANPFGAVLAIATLLITAYVAFGQETEVIVSKQKLLNDIRQISATKVAQEKAELHSLIAVARNENLTKEQRINAIKRINAISPEYLGNLTLENIKTQEATTSIKKYIAALDQKAMAEAIQSKKVDLMKKIVDEQTNDKSAYTGVFGQTGNNAGYWLNDTFRPGPKLKRDVDFVEWDKMSPKKQAEEFQKYMPTVQDAIMKRTEALNKLNGEMSEINKLQERFLLKNPNQVVGGVSTYKIPDSDKDKEDNDAERARKKAEREASVAAKKAEREENQHQKDMNNLKRRGEEADTLERQIQIDIDDARIEAMAEGFEKEEAALEIQKQRKFAEIDKKKINQSDYDKLQIEIDKAKGNDKLLFEALKTSWDSNNASLNEFKKSQEAIYDNKRVVLQQKYSAQYIKREEENLKNEIDLITREKNNKIATFKTVENQIAFLKSVGQNKDLENIRTWEDGKAAIEKYYQQQALERQLKFLQGKVNEFNILMSLNSLAALDPEQLKTIEEYQNKIAELLAQTQALKQGNSESKKGNAQKGLNSFEQKGTARDLLGMSPDEWEGLFKNTDNLSANLGKVTAVVGVMQQMFSAYFQFVEANEKRQLKTYENNTEKRKTKLKQQLDLGIINQETFKKKTIEADNDLAKRKSDLAIKQAKRERAMKIAEVITNTSVAIMQAYSQLGPIAGTIAAVLVGTIGAFQLNTIMNTPLPTAEGFEDGFNMEDREYPMQRSQDGKKFNVRRSRLKSGLVNRPTHFIAGEKGVEMVIDSPTWTTYSPELKSAIYSANTRAKGFETGFNTVPEKPLTSSNNDDVMIKMMNVLSEFTQTMKVIQNDGIEAYIVKSTRNGEPISEMVDDYRKLNNRQKR
ncbi:phage tail tape measure protein [Chryseobacterium sp.]|uniref:phage tail tape measure protein n=1 Tax=Chryseobacterium sp. TaxID=1871047 RepID=UPI00388FEE25